MIGRTLFAIRDLPRASVSAAAVLRGEEALSGTHTSGLLVAEGLARRGHATGIWIAKGQSVIDSRCTWLQSLAEAKSWLGDGRVIWLSYGDKAVLDELAAYGLKPTIWTQLPVSSLERRWLESGQINGIVVVSDTCRIPLLRSPRHAAVGRIYNPLAPSFADARDIAADRFSLQLVVYAGAAGPTKGLHRLLETWRFVHRRNPQARLMLAGTGRLYGSARELGPFGISNPEFEEQYVAPLAQEFGSLSAAGVEPLGLLNPTELRELYLRASLGVVNMNLDEYTETFCCAAVEMLATRLPVFSVARGALPETVGRSGGAVLSHSRQAEESAVELSELLSKPARLADLGTRGRDFVTSEYGLDSIVDDWIKVLETGERIETLSGPWQGPRSARFYLEYLAGRLCAPWVIDGAGAALRMAREKSSS